MPGKCDADGCLKFAVYGFIGSRPIRCMAHKEPEMVDVKNPICQSIECRKRPSYNYPGLKASFCNTHKSIGMLNVVSKRCATPNCMRQPVAIPRVEGKSRFCRLHTNPRRIDSESRRSDSEISSGRNSRGSDAQILETISIAQSPQSPRDSTTEESPRPRELPRKVTEPKLVRIISPFPNNARVNLNSHSTSMEVESSNADHQLHHSEALNEGIDKSGITAAKKLKTSESPLNRIQEHAHAASHLEDLPNAVDDSFYMNGIRICEKIHPHPQVPHCDLVKGGFKKFLDENWFESVDAQNLKTDLLEQQKSQPDQNLNLDDTEKIINVQYPLSYNINNADEMVPFSAQNSISSSISPQDIRLLQAMYNSFSSQGKSISYDFSNLVPCGPLCQNISIESIQNAALSSEVHEVRQKYDDLSTRTAMSSKNMVFQHVNSRYVMESSMLSPSVTPRTVVTSKRSTPGCSEVQYPLFKLAATQDEFHQYLHLNSNGENERFHLPVTQELFSNSSLPFQLLEKSGSPDDDECSRCSF